MQFCYRFKILGQIWIGCGSLQACKIDIFAIFSFNLETHYLKNCFYIVCVLLRYEIQQKIFQGDIRKGYTSVNYFYGSHSSLDAYLSRQDSLVTILN